MIRNLFLFAFLALCLSANGGILSSVPAPLLSQLQPSTDTTTCTLTNDLIISLYFLNACPGRCDICDELAATLKPITDIGNPDVNKETEDLVTFHCIKKGTSNMFPLKINADLKSQLTEGVSTIFIIHGFSDNYPGNWPINGLGWLEYILRKWAAQNTGNICAVNWTRLSRETLNYFVVSQINTERVAELLVKLLLKIETDIVSLKEVTVVGHSLGAQIAGKIGGKLNVIRQETVLGAIFGLDPAGPCYTFPCVDDQIDILDSLDAVYVQIIHTNAFFLGSAPKAGCHDFYINGGIIQPLRELIGSHYFACDLFAYTLDPRVSCKSDLDRKGQRLGIYNAKDPKTCGSYLLFTNLLLFYPYYC